MTKYKFGKEFFDEGKEDGTYQVPYVFDDIMRAEFESFATPIVDIFNPKYLLDFGCARGFLVKVLREYGVKACGIDVSRYALRTAHPDAKLYLCQADLDKGSLPFKDDSIDFITCMGTLEYLKKPLYAIQESSRVLKEGGIFYFQTVTQKSSEDRLRINIHPLSWWSDKFRTHGFQVLRDETKMFIERRCGLRLVHLKKKDLKFKVGKSIFFFGGLTGRKIVTFYFKNVICPPHEEVIFKKVKTL